MKAESETTEVIQGDKKVLEYILRYIFRARSRLDLSASYVGTRTGEELVDALQAVRKRGVRTRMVTEVTSENMKAMQAASRFLEIRHVAGLKGNSWSVTDDEYVSSLAVGEFKPVLPIIYSNARALVAEHQSIFDDLWERGVPLDERVEALNAGADLPELEIIRDTLRIKELYVSLPRRATKTLLLLLPSQVAFRRDDKIGIIDALQKRASEGVSVRILTPVDQWILTRLPLQKPELETSISFRPIPTAETRETVTLLIVDKSISLTIDESTSADTDFSRAVFSAVLATKEPRVRQSIRFFERVWNESDLRRAADSAREKEEASRKKAELMQDILTHDIRNFNQVARLNAELLADQPTDSESSKRISAIIRAIDGSTKLIERAKKLGNILSAGTVELKPISLKLSFRRSVSLVRKGNPFVKMRVTSNLSGQVLADELLDDVFINILSNAVKYSNPGTVRIAATQKAEDLRDGPQTRPRSFWKISVSDWGRGIPDDAKPGIFKRYMETAKGSGLGLSIVHALITERYGGKVGIRNRVQNDFSKGTTVEVWLPRPRPRLGTSGVVLQNFNRLYHSHWLKGRGQEDNPPPGL